MSIEERTRLFRRAIKQCSECRQKHGIVLHAMKKYKCEYCKKEDTHTNASVPRICFDCANDICRWCLKKLD